MILVVAGHPDDEVIGLGGQLRRFQDIRFVHITDGAPRDMGDAEASGFRRREDYAYARRLELNRALALAGIESERAIDLGFVDQEASFHLYEGSVHLASFFRELHPDLVFTHPYEGGHPDHDAAAFMSHNACRLLQDAGSLPPMLVEFACYHARNGARVCGEFLRASGRVENIVTVQLTGAEREFKQSLFECFATQHRVLRGFPTDVERFRIAPTYDFRQAPHPRKLFYENFGWGISGTQWRRLAEEAMRALNMLQTCRLTA
jgi:LmbE family N-acetylglucosaminyl deacetylase